jgi:hypothetical protein
LFIHMYLYLFDVSHLILLILLKGHPSHTTNNSSFSTLLPFLHFPFTPATAGAWLSQLLGRFFGKKNPKKPNRVASHREFLPPNPCLLPQEKLHTGCSPNRGQKELTSLGFKDRGRQRAHLSWLQQVLAGRQALGYPFYRRDTFS